MPTFRLYTLLRPLGAAAALVLLAGCGSSGVLVGTGTPVSVEQARNIPAQPETAVESQLLGAASQWMGVPYRFGGTTKSGVDCSAFVRAVYAGAYGIRLTRSTRTQVDEGLPVRRRDLRTGDLVFFRTGPDQRHVGIYLDGGRLLHASSSQNRVLVDDFSKSHFQRTFWTARRLLDVQPEARPPVYANADPELPVLRPAPPAEPAHSGPARSGW